MDDTGATAGDRIYFAQRAAEELELAMSAKDREAESARLKARSEARFGSR